MAWPFTTATRELKDFFSAQVCKLKNMKRIKNETDERSIRESYFGEISIILNSNDKTELR